MIDDRLRAYAERWRAAQPAPADDLAVSPSRPRRAWLVAAVAATALMVVAAVTVAMTRDGDDGKRVRTTEGPRYAVVPWIDEPAPPPVPTTTTTLPPVIAPPCTAEDIRVDEVSAEGATGHLGHTVRLRNAGTRACSLHGYPTVTATSAQGPLDDYRQGTFFPAPIPADIAPGAGGIVIIETTSVCIDDRHQAGPLYRDVHISMPGGGYVAVPDLELDATCGLWVSQLGVWPDSAGQPPPGPAPGSLATLKATSTIPQHLRAGEVAHFEVTLANQTPVSVHLDPCPGYRLVLYTMAGPVDRTYLLNCRDAPEIPAGGERVFDMVARVPDDAERGVAKFSWSMLDWGGPSTGAAVEVTD